MAEATVKMRKGNRVINIPKEQKDSYLVRGYDYLEGSKVVQEATGGKNVDVSKLNELKKENTSLKGQLTKAQNELKEAQEQLKEYEEFEEEDEPKGNQKQSNNRKK